MAQLTGKTVIVTGSSRGVGADTAQILAAEGANVVVNYRSKAPRAAKIVTSIEEAGGKAIAVQADVTNTADLQNLVQTAVDTYGSLTTWCLTHPVAWRVAWAKTTRCASTVTRSLNWRA